jgi:hypothetical protein
LPEAVGVMQFVVALLDQLYDENVFGVHNCAGDPLQTLDGPVIVTLLTGKIVIDLELLAVHPKPSVTVTV